jgi:hypothetical protein
MAAVVVRTAAGPGWLAGGAKQSEKAHRRRHNFATWMLPARGNVENKSIVS